MQTLKYVTAQRLGRLFTLGVISGLVLFLGNGQLFLVLPGLAAVIAEGLRLNRKIRVTFTSILWIHLMLSFAILIMVHALEYTDHLPRPLSLPKVSIAHDLVSRRVSPAQEVIRVDDMHLLRYDIELRKKAFAIERIPPAKPLESLSVVLICHNEHDWIKKTIDSIIEFSDNSLLREIVVVDDLSEPAHDVFEYNGFVKLIRNEVREGLIRSRQIGANSSEGDIIAFLDCHVKPEKGWERPVLQLLSQNYRHVVVPAIPILNEDWTQKGTAVGYKMMMGWDFRFNWFEDGNDDVPIMSGGLFMLTRQWWLESGEYDPNFLQWGAENIEQSIRIWLCGGEISVARKSRILHFFRDKFPYELDMNSVAYNKIRTIRIWFDEYAGLALKSIKKKASEGGDITARLDLRKGLKCKNFDFFVERFREVFTSRHMIHARLFQLAVAESGQQQIHYEPIPEPVIDQLESSTEVVIRDEERQCLIPVLAINEYLDELDRYQVKSFRKKGVSKYEELVREVQEHTNTRIQIKERLSSGKEGSQVVTVPCGFPNDALEWRRGGVYQDRLVYVGVTEKTPHECLQMKTGGSVVVDKCHMDSQDSSELQWRFHLPNGDSVTKAEQLTDFYLFGNLSRNCLRAFSPGQVEGVSTCDTATSSSLAEVNQRWSIRGDKAKKKSEKKLRGKNKQ